MTLIADSKGRVGSRSLFRPGKPYSAEVQPDGSVRLVELIEREVPAVKPVRTKEGFLMLPQKVERKLIRAAIRADRDAQ